jgi:ferric-dicitrate binding protein FerR (iron transport regulator)
MEELFDKYVRDTISPEEIDEFWQLVRDQQANGALSESVIRLWQEWRTNSRPGSGPDKAQVFQQIMEKGRERELDLGKLRAYSIGTWRKPLAVAATLLVVLAGVYLLFNRKTQREAPVVVAAMKVQHPDCTRHLILPDSSVVILHAGSRLDFPAGFPNNNREVTLSGTAYFDVHRDTKRPFIIHTGKIRTTVLGTAFNISSDGDKVTVSVTGGKVRVESDKKVLAELTRNEQIVYNLKRDSVQTLKVNAGQLVTNWTRQDMIFDGESFGDIAALVGKRYGVTIGFKDPELAKFRMVVSFSGTENLDNVLATLCTIAGASFTATPDDTKIVIASKTTE